MKKSKNPILFRTITKPNMHGVYGYQGNLLAEVVRVDNCTGEWTVFFFRDARIVVIGELESKRIGPMTRSEALQRAKDYLTGKHNYDHRPLADSVYEEYLPLLSQSTG